ncbi:MAG: hypothetical protein A3C06_00860 [Candidatus Taylorbacteria bacterium RIFCSPHIGHO2_02_FULL_46_13]|uniref:Uncharacterized protein n=1 Tax=Candidatus Taylorbacteria bacterium RIFCSPHIGHO2_02_FULL_46_13 TaxID=1802312 RepID=A0A1G2MQG2_9BACT|nr:MAG: hypothetical protein A3C06_00860 [Candidatus Taylorbacteria bacterium RIFCSPHIGHO2_02_FULL_46_13]
MSEYGRAFESTVEGYLQKLLDFGQIKSFTRHPPRSPEDYGGRDFTVSKEVGGVSVERSFGVTISIRSWNRGKRLHPAHPQFCFPIGTNKETINRRILGLFKGLNNSH